MNSKTPSARTTESGEHSGAGDAEPHGPVVWSAVGRCDPDLLGPDAPNWAALDADDRAELVKENPLRRVWRVRYAGRVFFAKTFLGSSFAVRVRRVLRRAPEHIEWHAARYATDHGVDCVRMAGSLQPREGVSPVRAVLVSEEVPDVASLADECGGAVSPRVADELTEMVARLFADAHRKRFLHRDPHPENILIRHDEHGRPTQAIFVDLQRARIGRDVTTGEAAANLAALGQWFRDRATATQRLRFLRAYLAHRNQWLAASTRPREARTQLRQMAALVDHAAQRHARRLYAKRDRRIFRQNAYFGGTDLGGGWRGRFTLRFRRRDVEPIPSQPDRTLREWNAWIRQEFHDLDNGDQCIASAERIGLTLVRQVAPTFAQRLAWAVRGSPNRRAFRTGHERRNRGRSVASPIALLERRSGGLVTESILLLDAPGEL